MSQQLTPKAKALLIDWEASDGIKQGCAQAVRQLFKGKTINTPQTATCPCCQNVFDSTDQPDKYKRIVEWSAARELGRLNAGVKKHLTPEQRQAKAQVLARNRAKKNVASGQ